MSLKELRLKDVTALGHELHEKQKSLFDLRSQSVTEKLEDPTQLGKTRRGIAQVKTLLREHAIAAEKAAAKDEVTKPVVSAAPKKA